MLKSQHHQMLLTLACITLLFGIVSCDSVTVYCSSSCTQTISFYATGLDSKTINVNLSPFQDIYLMVFVSENEQDIYVEQTSSIAIYNEVDVNGGSPYLSPGTSTYYSGTINLYQKSGSRYVGFTLYNTNYVPAPNVQLSLSVMHWRSYSSLYTISTGIIALIAILAAAFVIVAIIIAIYVRRKRLQRLRQQQSARAFSSPVIPTQQPLQSIQNQTLEQQQISYGIPLQNANDPYLQNTQYYINSYPAAQPQYVQGYVQGYPQAYPQGYDPSQPVYYVAQPQMQGPATEIVVQGQPQGYKQV